MRKTLLITLFLLALVGVVLYPQGLIVPLTKWRLASFCHKAFGEPLTYDKLFWQRGQVIVTGGALQKEKSALHFEKITFEPHFSFKKLLFSGEVVIEKLTLYQSATPLITEQFAGCFSFPNLPFVKRHVVATINQGTLVLAESAHLKELGFSVTCKTTHDQVEGSFELEIEPEAPPIKATFSRVDSESFSVSSTFDKHPLPVLARAFSATCAPLLPKPHRVWNVIEGVLVGHVHLAVKQGRVASLEGDLQAKQLVVENDALALRSACEHLHAEVAIDLQRAKGKGWNGVFDIQEANLCFHGEHRKIWEESWDLNHLNAKVYMDQGELKQTFIGASFLGMQGEIILNWLTPQEWLQFSFSGSSREMTPFIPKKIRAQWARAFPEEKVAVVASVKQEKGGATLVGELIVNESERLAFGCALVEKEEQEKKIHTSQKGAFWPPCINYSMRPFTLTHTHSGWFRGEKFPLEKYLSPFLFFETPMDLVGAVDFEGSFQEDAITWNYTFKNCRLQAPTFSIEVTPKKGGNFASHKLDLKNGTHGGTLGRVPLCFEHKKRGLTFAGVGEVVFEGGQIAIQNMEATHDALSFGGSVNLQIKNKEDIDLVIQVDQGHGPIDATQKLLSSFTSSPFWALPLKGHVAVTPNTPLKLSFHFDPKFSLQEVLAPGTLTIDEGKDLPFLQGAGLKGVTSSFKYDYKKDSLLFEHGRGFITKGSQEAWLLFPKVQVSLGANKQLAFEGGAKGKWWIVGETVFNDKDLSQRTVIIDPKKSFVKGVDLTLQECVLNEWKELLKITGTFKAESQELLPFISTVAFWLGHKALPSLRMGATEGAVEGEFSYTPQTLNVDMRAKKLSLVGGKFLPFACSSTLTKQGLTVHEVQLGEAKGEGELLLTEAGLKVRHAVVESVCNKTPLLFALNDKNEVSLTFSQKEVPPVAIQVGSINFFKEKRTFDSFAFTIPVLTLPLVVELLEEVASLPLGISFKENLLKMRPKSPFKGVVSLEKSPAKLFVHLALDDGEYAYLNQQWRLRNPSLVYDTSQTNFWTEVLLGEHYYWVHVKKEAKTPEKLFVTFSEGGDSDAALQTTWKVEKECWDLTEATGTFNDLKVALKKEPPKAPFFSPPLQGTISLEGKKALRLVPKSIAKALTNAKLGKGFTFVGEIDLKKRGAFPLALSGELLGKECELFGLKMTHFEADVALFENKVELKNIELKDRSLSLAIDDVLFEKEEEIWKVKTPLVRLHRLRPALFLQGIDPAIKRKSKNFASLNIRSCELHHFQGVLGEANSFVGSGSLQFTNFPRGGLISNILMIPGDIISRIGLDLTLFVPVRGMIDYKIERGKVVLSHFYEMFSHKKRSRFFLAKEPLSTIDFAGNLDINIQMKQYNLLMKIVELFQVNVQGTIKKPKYTFTPLWHVEKEVAHADG